ncbi:MAG: uroporphyrinogen decarboxylase [Candidatus Sumerlaeia bacterium]
MTDFHSIPPRQRLLRALRGEPADRVPAWLMRQAGRYLPQYQEVRRKFDFLELCKTPEAAAEVSIQPLEAIGSEAVIIFNDILLPLEHAGAKIAFDDHGPIVLNPVAGGADLTHLAERGVSRDEPVAETIREVRRRIGPEWPILGFAGSPFTLAAYWAEGRLGRQMSRIGALRAQQPELLIQLLERITRAAADYLRIQIEAGADAVQIFDTWGASLSQSDWGRFSAPYIRRLAEVAAPTNTPVILYIGGCAPYLEQVNALGIDAMSVDWRVELAFARARLDPKIALQGNLDPTVLLAGPAAASAAVAAMFEKFPPRPGHVFNLGHGVLPETPVESARAAIEAVKRFGVY